MSLRFEKKTTNRLRSTFSCKSRTDREGLHSGGGNSSGGTGDPAKSWALRQSKFACDYLNLMDPPKPKEPKKDGEMPPILHTSSKTGLRPLPIPGPTVPQSHNVRFKLQKLNEDDMCQCDSLNSFSVHKHNGSSKNNKSLPPILSNNKVPSATSGIGVDPRGLNKEESLNVKGNTMTIKRRGSMLSMSSSSGSTYAASTISSSSMSSSGTCSIYDDLLGMGYGLNFESLDMDPRPVDPYRFSQATLEDTQEDELNAILGELSALQMSLDREIKQPNILEVPSTETKTGGSGVQTENGVRTDSPDNDSGFSDNASLLSSGSSLSAAGSSSGSSTTSCALNKTNQAPSSILHASEDEKAEKIRVALAKMRAASVTRLYVKAFSLDGSSKALMVDESMTCGRVLALLADKNHVPLSSKWALVEHIPHLHMERVYEDHENMVENLLMWTRDSKNKIFFVERDDKYDTFLNPQRYFLGEKIPQQGDCMDEHTKNSLIEEFFNHGVGVPEVESVLYLKAEGKKAWKKFPFVLRASGIYYYPKGKSHANSSKDLVCLAPIDHNQQAYQGIGWRKKFKAPTEFGFVIKPARLQVKSHRHMKYLCAEDPDTLRLWIAGLRIAKYGKQLWENYRTLMEDLAHEDLDRFGRSVSLACMPQQNSNHPVMIPQDPQLKITPLHQMSQNVQNSGCENLPMQPRLDAIDQNMPPPPPLTREEGFESDCPVGGTIKRKPSTGLMPKIPLTLNTRSIVGDYINMNSGAGEGNTMTLQRKRSLSGNSSASSNSSISSQIHVNVNVPNQQQNGSSRPPLAMSNGQGQGKPPTGSLLRNSHIQKPAPVVEESADIFDYDSLPPPPPELLMTEESSPQPCRTPPIPPAKPIGLIENSIYSTAPMPPPPPPMNSGMNSINPPPMVSSLPPATPKKGVSFASELTERLKNRSAEPIYGSTAKANDAPRKTVSFQMGPPVMGPNSSLPNKLEDPPQDFLTDLQRVMQKKWQVAQKCHADKNTTPHEVLGFKFAPEAGVAAPNSDISKNPGAVNGEGPTIPTNTSHVQAWVSQHYGNTIADLPSMQQNHQNQTQPAPRPVPSSPKPPQRSATSSITYAVPNNIISHPQIQQIHLVNNPVPCVQNQNQNGLVIYENFQGRKSQQISNQYDAVHLRNKKPPPPVPKRADSTHLSAHIVFN